MSFSRKRLEQIFPQIENKKILIIGDVMIDEYLRGNVTRLSPEAASLANIAAGAVCEEVGIVPIELEVLKRQTLNI